MVGLIEMVNESFVRNGIPVDLAVSRIVSGCEQQPSLGAATGDGSSNEETQIGPPAPLPGGF